MALMVLGVYRQHNMLSRSVISIFFRLIITELFQSSIFNTENLDAWSGVARDGDVELMSLL